MIVDYRLIDALAVEFLRKRGDNYITNGASRALIS